MEQRLASTDLPITTGNDVLETASSDANPSSVTAPPSSVLSDAPPSETLEPTAAPAAASGDILSNGSYEDTTAATSAPSQEGEIKEDSTSATPRNNNNNNNSNNINISTSNDNNIINSSSSSNNSTQLSSQTESLLQRITENSARAAATGTPEWEAAREQVMKDMATSDNFPIVATTASATTTPTVSATPTNSRPSLQGGTPVPKRGRARRSSAAAGVGAGRASFVSSGQNTPPTNNTVSTPGSSGRGRGKVGRPRGRGRGGAARGTGKRKREGSGGGSGSDEDSESSEEFNAVAMTKSGRAVQKPTSFVPPPPSPSTNTTNKRRRTYRRNPESAVCRMCLRGTSPANNMIVFCDGCNTPYHRFCHHPPIDQTVIDEVDKEWYCQTCEKERVEPVPEDEVADFVSAKGASFEQRQRYFASLPPGMLVTLMTKATTLHPDLPVFPPDFVSRPAVAAAAEPKPLNSTTTTSQSSTTPTQTTNNNPKISMPSTIRPAKSPSSTSTSTPTLPNPNGHLHHNHNHNHTKSTNNVYNNNNQLQPEQIPDEHPSNYPRPGHGLLHNFLPSEHNNPEHLVDDGNRFGVFTHIYRVDANAAGNGLVSDRNTGGSEDG